MIITVKSETEGRGFNERLTSENELIKNILLRNFIFSIKCSGGEVSKSHPSLRSAILDVNREIIVFTFCNRSSKIENYSHERTKYYRIILLLRILAILLLYSWSQDKSPADISAGKIN